MKWWSEHYKAVYGLIIFVQLAFVVLHVTEGKFTNVVFDLACVGIVFATACYVAGIEGRRRSRVEDLMAAVKLARQVNDEDAERLFMQLIHVWGGDPP